MGDVGENVEIVRRAYTAFNDGDLETVFELARLSADPRG